VNLVSYHQQFVAPYVRARWGGKDDAGASLVEYALLVALIAVVCILAITFLGKSTSSKLSNLGSSVAN
jgi:pilus assembly protein Flp/PilA